MRNHTLSRSLLLASLAAALPACGTETPGVTVKGHKLTFTDTSYGQTGTSPGLFCDKLDQRGQFEVVIADFAVCTALQKPGATNSSVFHSSDETNLRLVFSSSPDVLKKIPPTTAFKVASTHHCSDNRENANAAAFFAHNTKGSVTYDTDVEADSGTINVNFFTPPGNATGSFDLTFAGERVTGSFEAVNCTQLIPGVDGK